MTSVSFFFNFAYWKDMNKDKEFKLPVLTGEGISTYSNNTSALPGCFPLRTTTKLKQSRKATARLSTTSWLLPLSLAVQRPGAWLGKASVEVQRASSSVLFHQAQAWMADENSNDYKSQRHPSDLQYRSYLHNLISFCERQWWDARKWTKPTFAKGMEKQKQVVK